MRRVLVLGAPPDVGRVRAETIGGDSCRVIGITASVCERLAAAGIAARVAGAYAGRDDWDCIHGRAARLLFAADDGDAAAWRDDWSHLLAEQLSADLFWASAASGIIARERPSAIWLQPVGVGDGACAAMAALASAFDALGRRWSPW
jgi:hypothetical protein